MPSRKDDEFESKLNEYIQELEQEHTRLMDKQQEIRSRIDELQVILQGLGIVKKTHLEKTGKAEGATSGEFAKITSIREAIHLALQKYSDMNKEQLRERLQKGGFNFGKGQSGKPKKPIPAIHLALVGDHYVTITERGTYQWIGNNKPSQPVLSLPKGVSKFFVERNNEPASAQEVFEGIKRLGVRTTTKDLATNVDYELWYDKKIEKTVEGKYRLKQDVFEAMKQGRLVHG